MREEEKNECKMPHVANEKKGKYNRIIQNAGKHKACYYNGVIELIVK